MPEAQLVPLQPRDAVRSLAGLRAPGGVYERAYGACYLAGRNAGPCVVAVNSDAVAHATGLDAYTHALALGGGNVLDGGTARIVAQRPPVELGPAAATIAFP